MSTNIQSLIRSHHHSSAHLRENDQSSIFSTQKSDIKAKTDFWGSLLSVYKDKQNGGVMQHICKLFSNLLFKIVDLFI